MTTGNDGQGEGIEIAVIAAALAAIVSSAMADGPYDLWSTMVGLILIAVLFSHWKASSPHWAMEIAYAGAFGMALIMVAGVAFDCGPTQVLTGCSFQSDSLAPTVYGYPRPGWYFGSWLVGSTLVYFLRRYWPRLRQ